MRFDISLGCSVCKTELEGKGPVIKGYIPPCPACTIRVREEGYNLGYLDGWEECVAEYAKGRELAETEEAD